MENEDILENNNKDIKNNKTEEKNNQIPSETIITNDNCKTVSDNVIVNNEDNKENKIMDNNEIIDNSEIKIKEEINKENNENKDNNENKIIKTDDNIDKEKEEKKPKNFGHSKLRVVLEEIKNKALSKNKIKKEEQKIESEQTENSMIKKNSEQSENNIINEEDPKSEIITKEDNNEYTNITEDGGIKKRILKEGHSDPPAKGKTVYIFFKSKYQDRIFDQSKENTVFPFTIGENKVIKGWEIAVQSMKIGEKADFIMTSDYTYGDKVFDDSIPAGAIISYEIELVGVGNNDSENGIENLTYEEKLQWGQLLKKEGVEKFKADDLIGAKDCFMKALNFLKTMDPKKEEEKEGVDLYLTTLSNICNCFNKEKEYSSVIDIANMGLKIKMTPKLLYFRAIAYAFTEEFEKANNDSKNLSEILLSETGPEKGDKKEIEQTLLYVNKIITERNEIYIEKNKKFSRATFRRYLYNNKSLENKPLLPPIEPNPDNPVVFFELKISEKNVGRIEFELFQNIVPRTAENFRFLCSNNKEGGLTYKGSSLNKVIKNFVIGGGEIENTKEKEKCLYGEKFDDENYIYCHCRRGLLSMDNDGKNTNNSKFLITLKFLPWLDGKHVVFGQIINGLEIIKEIEDLETDSDDRPLTKVVIENCGEIINPNRNIIKNEINQNIINEEETKKEEKKDGDWIIIEEKEQKIVVENEINQNIKEEKITEEKKSESGGIKEEKESEKDVEKKEDNIDKKFCNTLIGIINTIKEEKENKEKIKIINEIKKEKINDKEEEKINKENNNNDKK